jgi:UDP-N-acetylglucosamine diphosphorylase/glucosamine-1-phosphate N-acetyltransferase
MKLISYEDAFLSRLGPLAQTRPVYELRCGALTLAGRQARCLEPSSVAGLTRPEMEALHPRPVVAPGEAVVLANARWLAPAALAGGLEAPAVGTVNSEVAWVALPPGEAEGLTAASLPWKLARWRELLPHRPTEGVLIEYPWDLVRCNALALEDDERHWRTHREARPTAGLHVQGPTERLLIDPTARIEPLAFFDTSSGPVLVDAGAVVKAFSRLEGPCYVGPGAHVNAARVAGSSIGPWCRVGGEVEASILHGFSNKAHDGFLGHSYVGEWVNLGAGTQASNLRNDYGKVTVTITGQKVETGMMKVGCFIGDHTKSSIGTLLNTGSVLGPFAMLVGGSGLLPRTIPAFSLVKGGLVTERTDLREMFATARMMMARRGIEWTDLHADFYLDLYERTAGERQRLVRDSERRLKRVI